MASRATIPLQLQLQLQQPWQNRIVGHDLVPADQLLANPNNWRIHPRAQQEATRASLDSLGWVKEVIVNRRSGYVIDGHERIELALALSGDAPVPVAYVGLSPEEERQALATLDPIAGLAVTDKVKLDELLQQITDAPPALTDDVAALLADVRERFVGSERIIVGAEHPEARQAADEAAYAPNPLLERAQAGETYAPHRMVQLLLEPEAYDAFVTKLGELAERWGLESHREVVLRAVRDA